MTDRVLGRSGSLLAAPVALVLMVVLAGCGIATDTAPADGISGLSAAASVADDGPVDDGPVDDGHTDHTHGLEDDAAVEEASAKLAEIAETEGETLADDGEVHFSRDVQPILEENCASCHNEGQAGSEGFQLITADNAASNATYLASLAADRAMPPWPASELSLAFHNDRSLTESEIAALAIWADAGAPLDVEPDTPIVSSQPLFYIEDRDIVMTSAGGAYQGSTKKKDDYRCLVFEPGNDEMEWILGSHFEPDQVEQAHHAIVTMASAELRERAQELDDAEPGPGWTCYGGTGLNRGGQGQEWRIGGWAPGGPPSRQPDGYAQPMPPGAFIIVQIHYHFETDGEPDLSRFVLDLASDEQIAAQPGGYKMLRGALYLGPAEIPCYEGDTHLLCDRDAARKRVYDLYGANVARFSDIFLSGCGQTPEDFAHMTNGDAWSTCDLPVKNPGRIVSLNGHMHELGKSIRLTLNPDTPEEQILLDIPDWDFEWQLGYKPVDDIVLKRGDTIRVDCAWNRERAPYEAVGYILWADGTGDEMCYSGITTAPLS